MPKRIGGVPEPEPDLAARPRRSPRSHPYADDYEDVVTDVPFGGGFLREPTPKEGRVPQQAPWLMRTAERTEFQRRAEFAERGGLAPHVPPAAGHVLQDARRLQNAAVVPLTFNPQQYINRRAS